MLLATEVLHVTTNRTILGNTLPNTELLCFKANFLLLILGIHIYFFSFPTSDISTTAIMGNKGKVETDVKATIGSVHSN